MAETLPNIPMAFAPVFSEEPRVRRVKFGDGYEARIIDGLNFMRITATLPWENRSYVEMITLIEFFRRHRGDHWFWYTVHGESNPKKFVCPKWTQQRSQNSSITGPRFDISAEIYQVFDLV